MRLCFGDIIHDTEKNINDSLWHFAADYVNVPISLDQFSPRK